jgi:transposase-like protein
VDGGGVCYGRAVAGKGVVSKRRYSDDEKAAALAFLRFNGGNVLKSAKALGIPHKTLDEWAKGKNQHPEVADLRNEKKEEISALIEQAVREMVGASAGKLSTANFQQLWTSVGIAVDKMQLLKGEPTNINRDVTLTPEQKKKAEELRLRLVKKVA